MASKLLALFLVLAGISLPVHSGRPGQKTVRDSQKDKPKEEPVALPLSQQDLEHNPKETQGTLRDLIANLLIVPKAVVLPKDPCQIVQLYNITGDPMGYGSPDWSSYSNNSAFIAGPCVQVSGIHMVQDHLKHIIITDRNDKVNGFLTFPSTDPKNPKIKPRVAFAEEMDILSSTVTHRPLNVITNTFCSAGAFMSDGTLISIGGTQNNSPREVDGFSIRALKPCSDGLCDFTLAANMSTKRWYPTAQPLADGRILIVGGSYWGRFINGAGYNNPTIEYYPDTKGDGSVYLPFLNTPTMPYNLYPFVHLLPSGLVFISASFSYTLFNTTTNREVRAPRGGWPSLREMKDKDGKLIFRSYPATGTSAMFPLRSSDGYMAEIMICGGNIAQTTRAGYFNLSALGPADDKCWRIQPEAPVPTWQQERMCVDWPACTVPLPRVMGDAVLLADGSMLLINGGRGGYAGIPNAIVKAVLRPLIYNPYTKTWFKEPIAPSHVPRLYHSSAVLLHNGTVFISGSNPNNGIALNLKYYPSEFRSEYFVPPYFYKGLPSPAITNAPANISVGTTFGICFRTYQNSTSADKFRVVLAYPGFSTHSQRHGMRNIDLDIVQLEYMGKQGHFSMQVRAPPSLNIAPPTWYWIYLLDNGVPNKEGLPVFISKAGDFPSPPFPPPQCKL